MDSDFNCRLCGKLESVTSHHLPCDKSKYARDIKLSLNVDIENDPAYYPKFICDTCRVKLSKWRKDINKKKKTKINIRIMDLESRPECQDVSSSWEHVEKVATELGWIMQNNDSICFMKIQEDRVRFEITYESELNCVTKILGKIVNNESILRENIGIYDPRNVEKLIITISAMKICTGNNDFEDVCRHRYPDSLAKFENAEHLLLATEEHFSNERTIRTVACRMLCESDQKRCANCHVFRTNLFMRRLRMKRMSSETLRKQRLDYMTTNQLKERILNSKSQRKTLKRKNDNLMEQIQDQLDNSGVDLDAGFSESFIQIMKENSASALDKFTENSPQHILWKQQFEAASKPNLRQMRWHPMLLRWCIALHAKSPAAYRMIKKSNMLTLPHENTLRDYSKFTTTGSGWNKDVVDRCIQDYCILDNPLKKHISLLFDEVKVQSGLVYCSETGRLIGFCDLGSINNDIQNFCRTESETLEPDVATHILAVMIRGIFSNMECVVAHYPCKGFYSYQLFNVVWEGISVLKLAGFITRALVCDGATPNRKFYRLHGDNEDLCYFTVNELEENSKLYFICDAPHLMKTTRNNFENSGWNNKTRNLMFNGKPIKWSQVVSLVEDELHPRGMRLLSRITYEHLHLRPTLRMRVKLAVQILSSRVANALQLNGKPETQSTEYFIRMFDKFFDCMNVSNITTGTFERKPACKPYTALNDWRFKWLEEDFLGFLSRWEQQGEDQANLTAKEKKQLCLSRETLEGLRITVKSFVELGRQLLLLPNVRYLLSDKFNQDPLEYFSKQRGMGGFCDNPTIRQFQHNALKLQVASAPAVMASTRGNCRTGQNIQPIDAPLVRRKNNRQ